MWLILNVIMRSLFGSLQGFSPDGISHLGYLCHIGFTIVLKMKMPIIAKKIRISNYKASLIKYAYTPKPYGEIRM